jgi:putative ABC transport system permease protein
MMWLGALDVLRQDASYSWRSIRRSPGFTLTVLVTLALGIGANAATFTVLDRLYLRVPDGVHDPESIRRVWMYHSGVTDSEGKASFGIAVNYPLYRGIRDVAPNPRDLALYGTDNSLFLAREGRKTRVRGIFATASYFGVLGVRAAFGRVYTAAEDSLGAGARVVVLSHRFWEREFAGDSAVLGRTVRIETDNYTVIGVLPRDFSGLDLQAADTWMPLASMPSTHWRVRQPRWWENVNPWSFETIQRVSADGDARAFEQRASLAVRDVNRRLFPQRPDTLAAIRTAPLVGSGLGEPGQDMMISTRLSGVAIIVLLIACANVTNLLLARAVRRRREIAVRLALGISRGRLVRLLTTETVLLAVLAGAVAVGVAWWGGTLLRALLLPQVTWYESALHPRVVGFAFLVSLLAGLVAGIIPALQSSNPELTQSLKEGVREGRVHRSRLRQGLVVTQAAFSLMLLVGATLFVRSLDNVRGLDIGYDADRLLFAYPQFDAGQAPPAAVQAAQVAQIAQRFEGRPGVEGVARVVNIPMQGISFTTFFWGPGGVDSSGSLRQNFPTFSAVSPEFFRVVGLRFVQGRAFEGGAGAPGEVVVNEAMAAKLWPGRLALGECMRFDKRANPCYTVVGVVENARASYVIEEPKPQFYLPTDNMPLKGWSATVLAVRTRTDAMPAVSAALSAEIRSAFPTADANVSPMMDQLEPEYRPWRLGASLFTAFGLLALLVACIGIYSTVSYGVTQRRHEFGVRIALGARLGDVLTQVVGEGVRVVAVGIVVGVALALAAGKLIASLLYGVKATDPLVMTAVAVTLLLVAAAAALVPAWRASRVNPVTALRSE